MNKPRLAVRPIFERWEAEQQATQAREEQEPAFTEIFSMLDTARINWRKVARHATTGIAASVTVVVAFWLVANAGNLGRNLLQQGAALMAAFPHAGSDAVAPAQAASTPSPTALSEPSALQRRLAWLRNAAAKRATKQVAESFDDGMAAWGIKAKGWAPGWSRSPDGYVRPGQLALFQPTLSYADYRMEFFGQIEDNSMSWVVRGKDSENYYAMKVNIVKPGLRPVISMAHYPVVEGKQGHKVEVPLSFMVHNNTPYHVSVEVTGSHYTAFIEGEEVDSWSDDTLLAGGVGFFSEAGARARIYWMKVSKNDDWLGRLCKRIAGSAESRDTAWLVHPTQTPRTVGATAMIRIEPVDIFLTWRSAGLPD